MAGTISDVTARKAVEEALSAAFAANHRLVDELREALQRVKTLTGLIPIGMYCKKVRDDRGSWEQLEKYISTRPTRLCRTACARSAARGTSRQNSVPPPSRAGGHPQPLSHRVCRMGRRRL